MTYLKYHIISNYENGWSIVKEGNKKSTKNFRNRKEAINHAKAINMVNEVVVHTRQGNVEKLLFLRA